MNKHLRQRCRQWNDDHAHQVMAGKARAQQFTHEYQSAAGLASFAAFSARFRAATGSPPLDGAWVRKYLTADQIRGPMGIALPAPLQRIIYDAWCAGVPFGISYWLDDADNPDIRAAPLGSLFDPDFADHLWVPRESGWVLCTGCLLAAICPVCLAVRSGDPILGRLPQVYCSTHGKGGA